MRIELHVILWVIAITGTSLAIYYSSSPTSYLPSEMELGKAGEFPFVAEVDERTPNPSNEIPELVPTSIFPRVVQVRAPEVAPVAVLSQVMLKGIIGQEDAPKAVLASETGEYSTVGVGESFLDAAVLSVTSESVTLRRRDGSVNELILRGAGEQLP